MENYSELKSASAFPKNNCAKYDLLLQLYTSQGKGYNKLLDTASLFQSQIASHQLCVLSVSLLIYEKFNVHCTYIGLNVSEEWATGCQFTICEVHYFQAHSAEATTVNRQLATVH